MPPRRNSKGTSGPGGRKTGERGTAASTSSAAKRRKNPDPLTKDDIPTIVQAVLEALPGPSGVTNQGPQPTTEWHDSSPVLPTHSGQEHHDSRHEEPPHVDPSKHYIALFIVYNTCTHAFL